MLQSTTNASEYNQLNFLIDSKLREMDTVVIVRVEAVKGKRLTVKPLVCLLNGERQRIEQKTIDDIPYFTLQGGKNAILIAPQVNDLGIGLCCMRDVSAVKETRAESMPASHRKYSISDMLYIGGLLNDEPERFIEIADEGITVESGPELTINAGKAYVTASITTVNGDMVINGNISLNGDLTVSGNITCAGICAAPTIATNGIIPFPGSTVTPSIDNIVVNNSLKDGRGVEHIGHVHDVDTAEGTVTTGEPK